MLEATWTQANKMVCGDVCSTVCYPRRLDSWVSKTPFLVKLLKTSLQCPPSFPMGAFCAFQSTERSPLLRTDADSGMGTDKQHSGRQISAHTMGSLQGGGRKKEKLEAYWPENCFDWFSWGHQCIWGTQRLLLAHWKWHKTRQRGTSRQECKYLLFMPQHPFLLSWKPLPTNHATFFRPVYTWTQNSFTIVSYCDSHHNPST